MPRLDRRDSRIVPDQNGVDVVAEQLLRELGLIAIGGDEVGQWAEDLIAEARALREQRGGGRRQADTVALQRLKCGSSVR